MSKIGSAMGMEHAEEEGSSKHKTLVYRKIPDISPAKSEGMGSAVQIVDYTKVEIETHFKGPIELTSKDGVDGSMNVSIHGVFTSLRCHRSLQRSCASAKGVYSKLSSR